MASGDTGNVVPRKGLWVRVPCPPLFYAGNAILAIAGWATGPAFRAGSRGAGRVVGTAVGVAAGRFPDLADGMA